MNIRKIITNIDDRISIFQQTGNLTLRPGETNNPSKLTTRIYLINKNASLLKSRNREPEQVLLQTNLSDAKKGLC